MVTYNPQQLVRVHDPRAVFEGMPIAKDFKLASSPFYPRSNPNIQHHPCIPTSEESPEAVGSQQTSTSPDGIDPPWC